MKIAFVLSAAFALLVAGIEALKVLVAWWQAGWPTPGLTEWLSFIALLVAAIAWWRHSIFTCRNSACLIPDKDKTGHQGKA